VRRQAALPREGARYILLQRQSFQQVDMEEKICLNQVKRALAKGRGWIDSNLTVPDSRPRSRQPPISDATNLSASFWDFLPYLSPGVWEYPCFCSMHNTSCRPCSQHAHWRILTTARLGCAFPSDGASSRRQSPEAPFRDLPQLGIIKTTVDLVDSLELKNG
jgi:hypothetical protein